MRIAHLVLDGNVAGGQVLAVQFALAARDAGHDVLFVSPSGGELVKVLAAEGIRCEIVPLRRTYRLDDALKLARMLRRERVDVLHTHGQLVTNVLGRVGARVSGAIVISHIHVENHFRSGRAGRVLQVVLDNFTARLCARVLVVSEATRLELVRQGYRTEKMEVLPNGVALATADPTAVERFRSELGLPARAPLLVSVGRLCAVKGQRVLIDAVRLLARDRPDLRVVLVGDDLEQGGAFREELVAQIAANGLDGRVIVVGFRPDARVAIAAADVFVLPSLVEGQPLVVLESMAEGAPVVASSVGGVPELVVAEETGLLVEPGDASSLAAAVERLLADMQLGARLAANARRWVEDHASIERTSQRVLRVYDELAMSRP
jgi:glycosyltransferase involved in cell wall biosynthesis